MGYQFWLANFFLILKSSNRIGNSTGRRATNALVPCTGILQKKSTKLFAHRQEGHDLLAAGALDDQPTQFFVVVRKKNVTNLVYLNRVLSQIRFYSLTLLVDFVFIVQLKLYS